MSWFVGIRKWSVMVLLLGISTTFLLQGVLTGGEWVSLLKASTVGFFSANIGEHVIECIRKRSK